jgi:SAM-dependent methyltransferase
MKDSPYSNPVTASVYDRIAAPFQFTPPANDLVKIVGLQQGAVVLDVGTGTGVVATAAKASVGRAGTVVGMDAASEMIRLANKERTSLVIGQVPGLPFSDKSFDAVIAGFVVSHFESHVEGLKDMVRVLRTGGRIGFSAWGSAPNPAAALWSDIAGKYARAEALSEAFLKHIPRDTWFSRRDNLVEALREVHLSAVFTETRVYSVRMPTPEYLLSREASVQGLVLRRSVTAAQWEDFKTAVAEAFQDKFAECVEYERDAHFGVGTKP